MTVLAPSPTGQCRFRRHSEIAVALYATGKDVNDLDAESLLVLVDVGADQLGGPAAVVEAAREWAGYNQMLLNRQIAAQGHSALMGLRWPDRARLDACLAAAGRM